ncbi:Sulfotransferase domain containing protein [Gracilaria domingensis]|nr:Sulfotransferase domain containing protein [Gracilaria domingensis]
MASKDYLIGEYRDEVHAEDMEGIEIGKNGYKYRLLDDVMMPPYITPKRYAMSRSIKTRPGDICFTSFPKSGSTWLSYILVLIVNNGETPEDATLRNCVHWVASSFTYPRSAAELDAFPPPRIFKSHMGYKMAVGGVPADNPCRYIYIARNPKDVAVSYYFFERNKSWAGGYSGSWEDWLESFLGGQVQRGDWFDHVLSWWNASRTSDNILFLTYEDLICDFVPQVERLARFVGHPLKPEVAEKIREKTAFKEMRETGFSNLHEIKELGGFFRKAKIGSWSEQFTPAQNAAFDEIYARRMAGSGLEFNFGSGSESRS